MTPQNETEALIEEAKELDARLPPGPWIACDFHQDDGPNKTTVARTYQDDRPKSIWPGGIVHRAVVRAIDDEEGLKAAAAIAELRGMLPKLATALAAATEREKSWADHVLIASGGHAKTPLEAMKFIGSLRNMLDVAKGETKAATEREARYQELLADVWLYIDWRWVTKQLTTDQKELFADAVDADLNRSGDPDPKSDRWWRDDAAALSPAKPTEKNDE